MDHPYDTDTEYDVMALSITDEIIDQAFYRVNTLKQTRIHNCGLALAAQSIWGTSRVACSTSAIYDRNDTNPRSHMAMLSDAAVEWQIAFDLAKTRTDCPPPATLTIYVRKERKPRVPDQTSAIDS